MKLILTSILAFVVLSSSAWAAGLSVLAPDASEEHILKTLVVNVASGESLTFRSKTEGQIFNVRRRPAKGDDEVFVRDVQIKVEGEPSIRVKTKRNRFWNRF